MGGGEDPEPSVAIVARIVSAGYRGERLRYGGSQGRPHGAAGIPHGWAAGSSTASEES